MPWVLEPIPPYTFESVKNAGKVDSKAPVSSNPSKEDATNPLSESSSKTGQKSKTNQAEFPASYQSEQKLEDTKTWTRLLNPEKTNSYIKLELVSVDNPEEQTDG